MTFSSMTYETAAKIDILQTEIRIISVDAVIEIDRRAGELIKLLTTNVNSDSSNVLQTQKYFRQGKKETHPKTR